MEDSTRSQVQTVRKKETNSTRCAYCYVHRYSNPDRRFFSFPANEDMCKKWIAACRRPYLEKKTFNQLNKNFRLCSAHFNKSDFANHNMSRLKPSAVPSFEIESVTQMKQTLVNKLKANQSQNEETTATNYNPIISSAAILEYNSEASVSGCNPALPDAVILETNSETFVSSNNQAMSSAIILETNSDTFVSCDNQTMSSAVILETNSDVTSNSINIQTSTPKRKRCIEMVEDNLSGGISDMSPVCVAELQTPRRIIDSQNGKRRKLNAPAVLPSAWTPKTVKYKTAMAKYNKLKRQFNRTLSSDQFRVKQILQRIKYLVSPVMFHFISSQILKKNISPYARRWSDEEKNFFLQVFLSGPRAYSVLSSHFKIPTEKTLKRGLSGVEIKPGFISSVLSAMKIVSARLKPHQRICSILLDEMTLTEGFNYYTKTDIIIGFDNYGETVESTCEAASHALVFIVRGVSKHWKQVFGVFLAAGVAPSNIMKSLLITGIKMLIESGLTPVATVCDMGSNNQKLVFEELGVTIEKPFFWLEERKIYCIFDPPHLLKCMRNNFSRYKVSFNNGKIGDWDHIKALYHFDKGLDHRAVGKLTSRHVDVANMDKMSVRRASQVLSKSVAAALCYLASFNKFPPSASHTADFCASVNDMFDSMNSRELKHTTNPLLCAVTQDSCHWNTWQKSAEFMKTVSFKTGSQKINFPSLVGWQVTLSAFRQMVPELLQNMPFVLMNRFNQDALENFFSKVRRKGGNNDHPSPLDFLFRCRLLLAEGIMQFCKDSNCENDGDEPLVPVKLLNAHGSSTSSSSSMDVSHNLIIDESGFIDIDDILRKTDILEEDQPFIENPAAFVGGYLARFLIKNPKSGSKDCETCKNLLTQEKQLTNQTVFLEFKNFDFCKVGLTYPSENLIKAVVEFGQAFRVMFEKFSSKPGIRQHIAANLLTIEHNWFNCKDHGTNSWSQLVYLYTKMMIFNKVKYMSQQIADKKKDKRKYNKKMKKLK